MSSKQLRPLNQQHGRVASRHHYWHWVMDVVLLALIIGLAISLKAVQRRHTHDSLSIQERIDPIRLRSIVQRVMLIRPKCSEEDAAEIARVVAGQVRTVQPVLLAIIERESQYYPKARGAAGEYGLMQILPGTVAYCAWLARIPETAVKETIEGNILGGYAYWGKHYGVYGDVAKASTAYNGRRKGEAFPSSYGRAIADSALVLAAWLAAADSTQLAAFQKYSAKGRR